MKFQTVFLEIYIYFYFNRNFQKKYFFMKTIFSALKKLAKKINLTL